MRSRISTGMRGSGNGAHVVFHQRARIAESLKQLSQLYDAAHEAIEIGESATRV
jgi:hypothetical protein